MKKTLQVINQMQADGIIGAYAIGGAVAATFRAALPGGGVMDQKMNAILESKRRERRRLAALSFSEKISIVERLRDRMTAIADTGLYRDHGSGGGKAWVVHELPTESNR